MCIIFNLCKSIGTYSYGIHFLPCPRYVHQKTATLPIIRSVAIIIIYTSLYAKNSKPILVYYFHIYYRLLHIVTIYAIYFYRLTIHYRTFSQYFNRAITMS